MQESTEGGQRYSKILRKNLYILHLVQHKLIQNICGLRIEGSLKTRLHWSTDLMSQYHPFVNLMH
jgi:hypothetical protein